MKSFLKKAYQSLPLKRQFFNGIKSIGTPPESVYRHLHFNDKFKVKVENGKKFEIYSDGAQIANEVFWEGLYNSWEGKSIEIWREASKHSDVMFDIGANAGFYTLVAKTVNPAIQIHAFEPSNDWYDRFNRNCKLNGIDDIHSHKLALSNIDGETYIKSVWRNKDKNFHAVRLDTFLKDHDVPKIDLVKIDVEHYVVEMIEGFAEKFGKYQPNLMIEILRDHQAVAVEEILQTKKYGYLYFNINDKTKEVRRMDKLSVRADDMNYFICHEDMAKKVGLI